MAKSSSADTATSNKNNFGFLRLLFAELVIISHSPYLIDGNGSRELWHEIFGTTFTFGTFAVDGFFLISGYLITKSFQNSKSIPDYLLKRALRIYPGFLVAYAISFIFVGWLAGGNLSALSWIDWVKQTVYMGLLNYPSLSGAFSHLHYPTLNGSMWTIPYEFICYLFVIAFGLTGLLRNRWLYLIVALVLAPIGLAHSSALRLPPGFRLPLHDLIPYYYAPPIWLNDLTAFLSIFLVGGMFYLFRDRIIYSGRGALVAAALLLPLLYTSRFAEFGLVTLGAYIMFWFSFCAAKSLNSVGTKHDLSYGIYLYAWPVQNLFISYFPHISPWILIFLASTISAALAYLSWTFVEQQFLHRKKNLSIRRLATNASA